MGCVIKNPKNPYEFQCLFLKNNEDFSLYFHSLSGQQELIADCVYKERHECFFTKEGFNMTIDDGHVPTIVVSDTIWIQTGRFLCQKGGQLLNDPCPFPPPSSSTTSEGVLNTARDENFSLNNSSKSEINSSTPGEDNNAIAIIGAAIGAAVLILIILILVISILLLKKYKFKKSPRCPGKCNTDEKRRKRFPRQTSGGSRNSDAGYTDVLERLEYQNTISSSSSGQSHKPLL
ncbi:uncharacterized protein LOC112569684 [Pomacea canaliculata]|uniref:uncharacterized protein LOC112569684 n=1 Tax=Pomacea canaliculata TaxID=400727 RepID=UPI000D739FA2|nr:uncharacterized protein LOC112569684 [Pomacea canaliculata]XP_025103357.1 uncharacterized protein LOC112569684 [Pomacea canaliculata]